LVDKQRALAYFKLKMLEDLDFTFKSEEKNLVDFKNETNELQVQV
jgi:hypothetical protein